MARGFGGLKSRALEYHQESAHVNKKKNHGIKVRAEKYKQEQQELWEQKAESKYYKNEFVEVDNFLVKDSHLQEEKDSEVSEKSNVSKESSRLEKKGLPSPYECGERLKEKIHFISYNESLYYYNDICYDSLSVDEIIKLYRKKIDNTMAHERNLNVFSHVVKTLCTDSSITVKKFDANKRIVVFRNGIYDVVKEKLRPHTYKEITFSYIDADYVENMKCKYFDKFIDDVTEGDEKLKERFWMFIGYVLMQTVEAKVFFVMGEAPDSGKSLLGKFIESLYPERYVSNVALTNFNRNFSYAPIAHSAINISLDLPASRLNVSAVSTVKMLTGGDTFNIEEKYMSPYRYENRAKLIFASNFPISLVENDEAFWNRLIYLPFNKSIPKSEQDRELAKKFQEEKNAIVSKAVQYAKKLIEEDFCFPTTKEIEYKMQVWQGRSCATIENFLEDCCEYVDEKQGELIANLYLAYENYCDSTGYVAKTRLVFKQFLEEQIGLKHFKMRDGGANPQSAFRGIKLKIFSAWNDSV